MGDTTILDLVGGFGCRAVEAIDCLARRDGAVIVTNEHHLHVLEPYTVLELGGYGPYVVIHIEPGVARQGCAAQRDYDGIVATILQGLGDGPKVGFGLAQTGDKDEELALSTTVSGLHVSHQERVCC